ncbi:DUF2125 domain-containing protein [Commensalibacter papalotli (ex Servin-Garciduenas et al. 2014)]|uniref:DUF2125 domain-containing protein n=1 Tax=Commensalibacter papalotli (ex Servin-Garciduenas et al. 2014) TaxID=1208583 RepID=W7DVK2_9PROT|nr:DUF2125 domain-containing protein [Commensalibacter papalotli (ex Servin-Garciduenas et al. 2014)]EUK18258.1 hypothetical protein COMX_00870 [Commensalibacter papalotli (ex Servin-Garciduenas et al. 2014)]
MKIFEYYMFNRRKHLFIQKKTTYKKLFFISIVFLVLLGNYLFAHTYLINNINYLLTSQQHFLKKQNLTFQYKLISTSSWRLWPQVTLAYPTIQRNIISESQTLWQAKQATLSYSLWHPFSLAIRLDGEQIFCPHDCVQLHGAPWNLYIPFLGTYHKETISLQSKEIFYTNISQSTWGIQSLQLKNIQTKLHWDSNQDQSNSLGYSQISIQQALVNFDSFPVQKLNNIQLQAALIKDNNAQNFASNLYKLLIQKINFSWNTLSIHSTGKLYFPHPQLLPTGEMSLHFSGIDQTIYQQLMSLNCCIQLKQELSQTLLPSQLNLTLFIREGVIYLGAIPLQTLWYDRFKALVKTYTK